MQTFIFIDKAVSVLLLSIVFFASIALYNLHSIIGSSSRKSDNQPRYQSTKEFSGIIRLIILISIAALSSLLLYLPFKVIVIMLLLSLPSILYVIPIFFGKRLRDFSLLKIIVLSIIWPLVTVMLPYAMHGVEYDFKFYLLLLERALFVFSLALAFDIRDVDFDKMLGVETIPITIGKENSFRLAAVILLIWAILLYFIYPIEVAIVLNIVGILTLYLIRGTLKNQAPIYYQFYLDGTLAIQAILVSVMLYE